MAGWRPTVVGLAIIWAGSAAAGAAMSLGDGLAVRRRGQGTACTVPLPAGWHGAARRPAGAAPAGLTAREQGRDAGGTCDRGVRQVGGVPGPF
ncbi:MAG: hypothetical protein M5U01_43075 [Ardenticatenaceae bacterium]|nr:hypothetical protein [Ardenticatenaceae bacterium]